MSLRFLVSQKNFIVAEIENNAQQMIDVILHYQSQASVDVVIFSELSLTGYPVEDWLFRLEFQERVIKALKKIQESVGDIYAIVGHPSFLEKGIFNAVSVFHQRKVVAEYHKQLLPNYGIFDEKRYFTAGTESCTFEVKNQKIGLLICEDIWWEGPWKKLMDQNVQLIIAPNASPFERNKAEKREAAIRERQHKDGAVPVIYAHGVGGQDELVFDGQSFAMNAKGDVCWRAKAFEPDEQIISFPEDFKQKMSFASTQSEEALIYQALVLGTRDYIHKNGFKGAVLGLSGGIDSALTLAIAVDALGADAVEAVMMPSRYTAPMSLEDAKAQIDVLKVKSHEISIEPLFNAFLTSLSSFNTADLTLQNLQARCRGVLLMALSNETGKLLLTTGNKSELAMGYCTLYGDMAGGFAVLKDVLKTWVYRLARYRNSLSEVSIIPERVLTRAPSAELAFDQTDQDSLPPYDILDSIIEQYVENNQSPKAIIASGIDEETVRKTIRSIHKNEYKRRQSAPGVKITSCAFGKDWRYPMTQKFYNSRFPLRAKDSSRFLSLNPPFSEKL